MRHDSGGSCFLTGETPQRVSAPFQNLLTSVPKCGNTDFLLFVNNSIVSLPSFQEGRNNLQRRVFLFACNRPKDSLQLAQRHNITIASVRIFRSGGFFLLPRHAVSLSKFQVPRILSLVGSPKRNRTHFASENVENTHILRRSRVLFAFRFFCL